MRPMLPAAAPGPARQWHHAGRWSAKVTSLQKNGNLTDDTRARRWIVVDNAKGAIGTARGLTPWIGRACEARPLTDANTAPSTVEQVVKSGGRERRVALRRRRRGRASEPRSRPDPTPDPTRPGRALTAEFCTTPPRDDEWWTIANGLAPHGRFADRGLDSRFGRQLPALTKNRRPPVQYLTVRSGDARLQAVFPLATQTKFGASVDRPSRATTGRSARRSFPSLRRIPATRSPSRSRVVARRSRCVMALYRTRSSGSQR